MMPGLLATLIATGTFPGTQPPPADNNTHANPFYNDSPQYDCLKCGPTTHPIDPDGVCINCYKETTHGTQPE